MNKHFSRGFMCLIASAAVIACTKEPMAQSISVDQNGQIYTFEAVQVDSDGSKTIIENETAVYWSPKDSINVFYGTKACGKFVGTNTKAVAKTTFNGIFNTIDGSINIGAEDPGFWGVYPYRSDAVCYGSSVSVVVPAVQTAMEGTFAPDLFPAVAKSSGLALAFYNVCGGVMFTVSQNGITSVSLKGNNGEKIAGSAKVGMDSDGKPQVSSFTSGAKEITVNAPGGGSFKTGVKYYIVAYPATLSNGFSLTYNKMLTTGTFTSSASVSIKRSVFAKVEGKDAEVTFGPKPGNISFADPIAKQACVEKFDTDKDGEVSYAEAFAVTTLKDLFYKYVGVTSFEELKYFVNVTDLQNCFYGCPKIKTVTIPENITTIGTNSFRGCTALETLVIPSTVTVLGTKAFYGCTALDEITIPASVTEIGSQCFGSDIKTVNMRGTTPPSIEDDTFVLGTVFYVPSSALNLYKNTRNWIAHENNIKSILGGANCFVISSYGPNFFDCSKKGNSDESVGEIASAEVLWESFGTSTAPNVGDVVSGVTYSNGKVNFTANADGNAVIAVKDASGNILWSWHIWVCKDFDPSKTAQVYNNNAGTMMDRNLGAISATPGAAGTCGLLYQWGRKDPFIGGSDHNNSAASTVSWPPAVSSDSSNGTIAYAVAHPTTFIKYNSNNYDWYYTGSSSTDNTRWQTIDKTKGIYDPCPQGWRVPDGDENGVWSKAFGTSLSWETSNWDSTNKGMDFGKTDKTLGSGTIWYPSAGYRRDNDGSLGGVGGGGNYWSCTPIGYYVYNLCFNSDGNVDPAVIYSRARGRSVRCIKDTSSPLPPVETYKDLSEKGTANCYVVNATGKYKFNATVKGGSTESVGTPASAAVLWESFGTDVTPSIGDIVKNISLEGGYVMFSTPSSLNNGNAVIAVNDASGNILWSWHIWVCKDFDPAKTAHVYNNNAGTMMDRNLGATSATKGDVHAFGLLYQWGRKDPFLGSSSISSNTVAQSTLSWPSSVASDAGNGTIAYAVAHPTTFIKHNSKNYDWYYTGSSSTDNIRWQTSDKDKGMYDPCPQGWRVPDGDENGVWSKAFGTSSYWETASNWDSINKGMDFGKTDKTLGSGTIWYPAPGYRNSNGGSLVDVGSGGSYWSCTPYGRDAYYLFLYCYGSVTPSSNCYRASGQSVRCIKEESITPQPEYVDLGLSVKWAKCNIGASKPEEYGRYFAWGDVVGQTWDGSKWSGGGFSTYPSYELDAKGHLKPEYDAAHVLLGGKWRMPTKAEQQELNDNCTSTWTNIGGVNGRLFTSKKEGYTDKSIFLPAAGGGDEDSDIYGVGSYCYYWSSTFSNGNDAWYLFFYSGYIGIVSYYRYYGFTVRPVSE